MQPPWMELFRRAADSQKSEAPVFTLATVDEAGAPRARSAACRRVGEDGSLWFTSDGRSEKNVQLAHRPEAEAVCWFAPAGEQFRFAGSAEIISSQSNAADRLAIWGQLPPATRATFFWPAPGRPKVDPDEQFPRVVDALAPPENFTLILLRPRQVEQLKVGSHPHRRRRWTLDGDWKVVELNP